MKNNYEILHFDVEEIKKRSSFIPEKENAYIVETAGFVPFEVRFKQMEQNGIIASLRESDFTISSNDLRNIYFGENTEIYPDDDLETVNDKLILQQQLKLSILQEMQKNLKNDSSSTENKSVEDEKDETNKN